METRNDSVNIEHRFPVGSENVETNSTTGVDVRVIDLSIAVALWWIHWIKFWNFNCKFIFAAPPLTIYIFQIEKNFELHLCGCIWETDNAMQIIFDFCGNNFCKIFLNSKLGSCHSSSSRASCFFFLFLAITNYFLSYEHFN